MTEREKQLIVGVIVRVYTCTLDSSKTLDEQCEDFVSLGEKVLKIMSEQQKEDNTISQKIKFHENKIKDLQHEMYIQKITNVIPQVNPLKL